MARSTLMLLLAGVCLLGCGQGTVVTNGKSKPPDKGAAALGGKADEEAIRKNVSAYVTAFSSGDAAALAKLWADDAVFDNHSSGTRLSGRAAIQAEFEAMFADGEQGLLDVAVERIRFVAPDVAIEDGRATVLRRGELPTESTYTAIHVKRQDTWLIAHVLETETPTPPSNYEYLRDLDWMVGQSSEVKDKVKVDLVCEWALRRNFLIRTLTVTLGEEQEAPQAKATLLIGWDPLEEGIRCWVFDSSGGVAQAVWSGDKKDWVVGKQTLIERLRETAETKTGSHHEQLEELAWMVGEWLDEDEDASVSTVCDWTPGKNFLTRTFTATVQGRVAVQGIQVIGWDGEHKRIRSWLFDSSGGFGEGLWSRDGKRWLVNASQVKQDATAASAINIFTQVDQDAFTWQSTGREIDGELMPDIGPVKVVRKRATDKSKQKE